MAIASRMQSANFARTSALLLAAIAAVVADGSTIAIADGFRIETKIYVGDEDEPVSEATTLFLDGVVYDFLKKPAHVAVFRRAAGDNEGRFVLLNSERGVRTELTTSRINGAMDKLKTWAARQTDPFLQFAANPQFDETFTPETGELVLASHLENYTVSTTRADHPNAIADYREFLDWYARLNTLLSAGPPPEPRLELNDALARHNAVPLTVKLTRTGEKEPLRAEHNFTWRLSREDMERIDDVRASMTSYRLVPNEEFAYAAQKSPKSE